LYIHSILDAGLSNWSIVSDMKSPNMISAIVGLPRIAVPVAKPTIDASLIGMEITRSGNRDESPFVTLNAPP